MSSPMAKLPDSPVRYSQKRPESWDNLLDCADSMLEPAKGYVEQESAVAAIWEQAERLVTDTLVASAPVQVHKGIPITDHFKKKILTQEPALAATTLNTFAGAMRVMKTVLQRIYERKTETQWPPDGVEYNPTLREC